MKEAANKNNWAITRLDDIATRITKGGTPTTYGYSFQQSGINFIKVENVENGRVSLKSITDFISEDAHNFQAKSQLKVNDILFSIAGTIGETCVIREEYLPANTNQALAIIKGTDRAIIPKLLQLQLEAFVAKVKIKARGGAMNNVSLEDLKNLQVYIPPLPEQLRIVARIEELFSDLDKGIKSLKTAQQQLKVYRQAVLKWAFEGRLTNKDVKDGELPEGWKKHKLGKVIQTIDGDRGPNYPKKEELLREGYCLFLSTKNVREDRFVFDENIFISKEKDGILRSGKLQLNDVVVTTRGTLGNVALYDEKVKFKNIRINSGMLILRITDTMLNNYYLMKFITSPQFHRQLKEKQSGTAQPQIPANVLREIEMPIPQTLNEQHRIVSEIEDRLSVCDKMEESISQSLQQAEALRQSILKKAFEGKLVPQDSNDEPAGVLLERIRGERGKARKTNPSRPPL